MTLILNSRLLLAPVPFALVCIWLLLKTQPEDSFEGELVMVGPTGPLKEQVNYLRSTWKNQFMIAVLEAIQNQKCNVPREGDEGGRTIYCWLKVRPSELIFLKWFDNDPMAPDDEFLVHYWYSADRQDINFKKGDQFIAFLAPTHGQGIYSCTIMIEATPRKIEKVRNVLNELIE